MSDCAQPRQGAAYITPARNGSWNWLRTSLIVSLRLAIAVFALLSRVSIIDMM